MVRLAGEHGTACRSAWYGLQERIALRRLLYPQHVGIRLWLLPTIPKFGHAKAVRVARIMH
jgi:hypothetical protein